MDNEIWKPILDFPNYEVSNMGRVRNVKKDRILIPKPSKFGYMHLALYNADGYRKNLYTHRLVAEAFIPRDDPNMQVNHIDGDKSNNVVDNLEWCTASENCKHAFRTGLKAPIKHPNSMPVRIVETGESFASLRKCANAMNGDRKSITRCLDGVQDTHKGLHFEYVTDRVIPQKQRTEFLYDYQLDAVNRLRNGSILCGSVGSGKSRTGLYYYFKENGGWIDGHDHTPMKDPQDLYVITTAKKRDTHEFVGELAHFRLAPEPELNYYDNKVVIDSWNNIGKYKDVKGAFFLLDEQRIVGSGAWVKSFLKIAKNNNWILLTATPGDSYQDYIPVFLANGFFKNRTEFNREHVIYSRFSKYPKIDRYVNTRRLDRLRDRVLVKMNYEHKVNAHHEDVYCNYDISLYRDVMRKRWDPYNDKPIEQAAGLCYTLRRVVNSDESRQIRLLEIMEEHPKVIIFYNYNYELEILRNLYYGDDVTVAEYNGQKHQDIPTGSKWVYLCQYTAAAEGWECIKTNCIVFYSQNYSYKITTQAAGRIDRLNSPFSDLYYYHLKTRSGIDLAISKALSQKKKFNETRWVKW